MKKYVLVSLVFIFFITSLHATKLYVVSPVTKLLEKPNMSSKGSTLKKGTSLKKVGQKGMFYKVKAGNKTGWVSKIFVSKNSPLKSKVSFGKEIEKSTARNARRRSSSYTETASARGLNASDTIRVDSQTSKDYDFESIKWMENQKVSEKELNNFYKK